MGIPGIYKELGPGERISLAKLSVQHLESTERRFRLAIDISIWQFQIQSGEGGRNPALRTLYYRLLKLLGLGICPLFVFDGPYKPKLKRNVKSSLNTACPDNYLTKQLLTIFKFPFHDAPGEAEAECALLHKEGIVDAVLSEDVDTLMFGCTLSLRSWTAEGGRSRKTPTHVTMYTAEANKRKSGLDSCGMILVALMSGGDYKTEGVRGCGPRIACDAARAGFGRELCQLTKDDQLGWTKWRTRLQHELYTNESGFFKQKNKSIDIPEDFPDQTILNYYTHPVVSSLDKIDRLKESVKWNMDIDSVQLRAFVVEAFNWTYLIGAKLFIRTFAPAFLAHKLLERSTKTNSDDNDDLEVKAFAEGQLVVSVHARRAHWNMDGFPELRVSYVPSNIAGLDLSLEEDFEQPNNPIVAQEDDVKGSDSDERHHLGSPSKRRGPSPYDPNDLEKIWISETFLKLGTPLLVECWEEDLRDPRKFATRKAREREALSKAHKAPSQCGIDQFVKIKKPIPEHRKVDDTETAKDFAAIPSSMKPTATTSNILLEVVEGKRKRKNTTRSKKNQATGVVQFSTSENSKQKNMPTITPANVKTVNPWRLSKRPSDTYKFKSLTRYSALGIYAPDDAESLEPGLGVTRSSNQVTPTNQRRVPLNMDEAETSRAKHVREGSPCSDLSSDDRQHRVDNITYRTSRSYNHVKHSPRKKKILPEATEEDNSKILLRKSSPLLKGAELIDLDSEVEIGVEKQPCTPGVNRRLDFVKFAKLPEKDPPSSSAPVDSALHSPSISRDPKECLKKEVGNSPSRKMSQSIHSPHSYKATVGDHVFISLRESLEGAWKTIEPWQASSAQTIFTSVEVLDLTDNG